MRLLALSEAQSQGRVLTGSILAVLLWTWPSRSWAAQEALTSTLAAAAYAADGALGTAAL